VPAGLAEEQAMRFSKEFWRRRPDLNRGWRFCRQGRDVHLVDSSCFLVGPTPSFSLVLGRYCSQIVPTWPEKHARRRVRIILEHAAAENRIVASAAAV
jgi:hypothetical protein